MNPETIKRWSLRLWPELATYSPDFRHQGFLLMSVILTVWPFLPLAIVWLALITDWRVLQEHALLLLFLMAVTTLVELRPYYLIMRFSEDVELPYSSSLAGILRMATLLIFGPSTLWLWFVSSGLQAAWGGVQAWRNQNQHPLWTPLNTLLQSGGTNVLMLLLAAAAYQALGGRFPLDSALTQLWLPGLGAVLVLGASPFLIYLPMLITVNRLNGVPNTVTTLFFVTGSSLLFVFASAPFAIPLAVVYREAGAPVFIALTLGIAMANQLTYSLSRASITNRARVEDLAWLENVSEEMIQAPPDASTLAELLANHLPRQFAQQHLVIKLFKLPETVPWPTFEVVYPPTAVPDPPIDWEALRRTNDSYLIVPNMPARRDIRLVGHEIMTKITVPLQPNGDPVCVGGIYLHRDRTAIRSANMVLPTLQDLASQIGAALTRARSHFDMLAQQKMAQELAVAGRIQASFLPAEIPQLPGYEIAAKLIPARETSGDFYDFVPLADGRIGLLVADVADKGTGAALYMALSRTLIRTYAMQFPDDPAQALAAANERILADTKSDQFVTVFYAVLDPANGRFTYANAGHNPAFLINGEAEELSNTGIPLGMFPGMQWQQHTRQLAPGALLVMYTDGVSEAQNDAQVEFGEVRLLAAISANGTQAAAVQAEVIAAVQGFVGDAPQFDDITLMVVRRGDADA